MTKSGTGKRRERAALALLLAASLLFAVPAHARSQVVNSSLTGTASADYTVTPARQVPPTGEDPRCQRLREKLTRQKRGLAKAPTARKRAFIRRNIGITKRRFANDGCNA
jgi:hypothetical protein